MEFANCISCDEEIRLRQSSKNGDVGDLRKVRS